jgi:hypothetical protein
MSADVEECIEAAVVATHDQDRHAAQVVGAVVARLRQLAGEPEEQRTAAKQHLALTLRMLRAGVGGDGIEVHGIGQLGGVVVHEADHPLRQRDLRRVFHDPSSGRRCRSAAHARLSGLVGAPVNKAGLVSRTQASANAEPTDGWMVGHRETSPPTSKPDHDNADAT